MTGPHAPNASRPQRRARRARAAEPTRPRRRTAGGGRWPLDGWRVVALVALLGGALAWNVEVRRERGDAWGCLLTAQALVAQGTVRLDAWAFATGDYQFFTRAGHRYYFFPVGTPVLAAPAVAVARAAGMDMSRRGDDARVQRALCAGAVALSLALMLLLARRFVSPGRALALALVFGLGSMVMSTNATALFNTVFAVPALLGALLLVARAERGGAASHPVATGLLLFAAYLCRPTALPTLAAVVALTALRRPRELPALLGALALPAAALVAFSWREFHQLLPDYYLASRVRAADLSARSLWGVIGSPSRGLLVFCPYLLVTLAAAALTWRRTLREPLFYVGVAPVALQVVATASYYLWWGGWSFGPRLFTDAVPSLLLATLVAAEGLRDVDPRARRATELGFAGLGVIAIALHTYQGAYSFATERWNRDPDVDTHPARIFDWSDPQFLATDPPPAP